MPHPAQSASSSMVVAPLAAAKASASVSYSAAPILATPARAACGSARAAIVNATNAPAIDRATDFRDALSMGNFLLI